MGRGRIVGVIVILARLAGFCEMVNYILVTCMPSNEKRSIDEKSMEMETWNFDTKESNISSRKLIRGVEETVPLKIVFVLSGYLERLPRYEGSKCG